MVGTLTRRVERLEASLGGGDDCPRCKNTIVVVSLGGEEISVTQSGNRFPPERAKAFYQEELPNGQCPACGNFRERRVIRWGPR